MAGPGQDVRRTTEKEELTRAALWILAPVRNGPNARIYLLASTQECEGISRDEIDLDCGEGRFEL